MIPATALGGVLIEGWTGPGTLPDGEPVVVLPGEYWGGRTLCGDGVLRHYTAQSLHLDPTRPEVAHRIADVLRSLGHEVGHLLPVALGGRVGDTVEVGPSCGADAPGGPCDYEPGHAQPHKTGNTRMLRPVPAAHVSARLLAASVEGVDQGRGVVRGVLGERVPIPYAPTVRGRLLVTAPRLRPDDVSWWSDGGNWYAVDDDDDLLRLGGALLDPAAPDGVVVPGDAP